jgi:hypothetical protein
VHAGAVDAVGAIMVGPSKRAGIVAVLALVASVAVPGVSSIAAGAEPCPAPAEQLTFEMHYIDEHRAGGEPMVHTLDDGTLLWGSHAGTTHFFAPAAQGGRTSAFVENYKGQTYQYYSTDNGETWEFVEREPISAEFDSGLPLSGFSDPEFAVDQAGNIYISEINLANVAVSKSTDGGRSYELSSLASIILTDRQWTAADEEDVLYMTANGQGATRHAKVPGGHYLTKSVDGGKTFSDYEYPNPNGIGDIEVDWNDGTLYELSATAGTSGNGTLSMAAFRDIRDRSSNFGEGMELSTIAEGAGYTGINRLIDPTFDIDDDGNLYVTWSENGTGRAERSAGIYYAYSTDQGRTWSAPQRVDTDGRTAVWPWITVGDAGQVAINYFQTERQLTRNNAETAQNTDGWNVMTAYTHNGLGCEDSEIPGFAEVQASSEPVHYGTICQGGTLCQAQAIDRRLGDYFANEIDGNGNLYISVSDTRQGGAVALPLVIRQVGGPAFTDQS